MSVAAARAPLPWRVRAGLGAILLGAALLRLRFLAVPLERDEGEYAYMGQLILAGETPYLAAQNMKLPGTYYAYAGILALFGESGAAVRGGLLVVNLVCIVLVFLIGRRLVDTTAGLAAAAAFAVLSLSPSMLGFTANAEHFVLLPMLGGLLLLAAPVAGRDPRAIGTAGMLLGVAFLMKQHGAAFVALGGVLVLAGAATHGVDRWRRGAIEVGLFGLGALLPFALLCLGLWWAGAFERFWFWTFTYAREYAVALVPVAQGLARLREQVVAISGAALALWLLAAVGATALLWDVAARRRAGFLAALAGFSFLAVFPGMRFTDHYFLLLVPAASLLVGVAVSALGRIADRAGPVVASLVRVGLPAAAVLASLLQERAILWSLSPVEVSRAVYGADPFPEAVEIGRYLREHSDPADRVAVVGSEPEIYFYSGRRAATSYVYTYPLMEPHPFARGMQDEMIAQIEREKPRYLVLVNVDNSWTRRPDSPSRIFEWAEREVNERYVPVGLAEIRPDGSTTYRWGDEARTAVPGSRAYVVTFERQG